MRCGVCHEPIFGAVDDSHPVHTAAELAGLTALVDTAAEVMALDALIYLFVTRDER